MRLFVGLELPENVIAHLSDVRFGVESANWQTDEQLHLTLAFIGEVTRHQAEEIITALSKITYAPFDVELSSVGFFGKAEKPKTLWAGVKTPEPLSGLHEKILTALDPLGLDLDARKYKPHVTLARFRKGTKARFTDWIVTNGDLKAPIFEASYFTLFSSTLTSEGPFYAPEARFEADGRLAGTRPDQGFRQTP